MNEKVDIFNNAEGLIRKNFKKILFILLITLVMITPRTYVMYNMAAQNLGISIALVYILDCLVYPVTTLGVCYYAIKLLKGENPVLRDIFYFYKNRVKEALFLAIVRVAISVTFDITSMMANNNIIEQSLLRSVVMMVILAAISVKLVLVPFIFVEGIEDNPIKVISKAWRLSKGYTWDIVKIYGRIILITGVVAIGLAVIGIGLSIAFPWILIVAAVGIVYFAYVIGFYSKMAFAGFSLNIFSEAGLINTEKKTDCDS